MKRFLRILGALLLTVGALALIYSCDGVALLSSGRVETPERKPPFAFEIDPTDLSLKDGAKIYGKDPKPIPVEGSPKEMIPQIEATNTIHEDIVDLKRRILERKLLERYAKEQINGRR